ncbi:OmpA family protein [Flavobacterium sp. GSP27]|uniref:OmpA family protein n=1 Tax=unclassified Flavobacterium TaxID=196869 RepID=UPI000F827AB4|nr:MULTISPECIES: OmpA family protein [unclassified Flavobacterium]RTY92602.1 OmpA family protein [Flavobacterium sp. RSP46]RTY96393.1 OmpA family protein [Flavobacterium sp. GSN2]RTZ11110.1 OmpA family protein [Flavobacterium sp. GSP27]
MKKSFSIVLLLFSSYVSAQWQPIETVYFEFDKFTLYNDQIQTIVDFIKNTDTSKVESIQIYGYCDDRGANDYNYELSKNRVITVQNILIQNGFSKNKIVIIEGKGRVILKKDMIENLSETRSKNRRVDLFLVKKNSFGNGIYNSFQKKHKVGDRIYLENILFPLGSSTLTEKSKKELDKIVVLLQQQKTLEFEIRGHVCCTPSYYLDAIDKGTRERKLSLNRAKNVYKYLINKGVNSLRMHYIGSGNKFPLGQGEALDRRVEFLILKI